MEEGRSRERRARPRRKITYPCWVADQQGELRNISELGAMLEIDSAPDKFLLFLTMDGDRKRPCRVIWREGRQVGVMFDHSIKVRNGVIVEID